MGKFKRRILWLYAFMMGAFIFFGRCCPGVSSTAGVHCSQLKCWAKEKEKAWKKLRINLGNIYLKCKPLKNTAIQH
jgi:hypothetical protein